MKKIILLLVITIGCLWANIKTNELKCDVYLTLGDEQMEIAQNKNKRTFNPYTVIDVATGLAEAYYSRYGICIERARKAKPDKSIVNFK